jgi:hypothetical protein
VDKIVRFLAPKPNKNEGLRAENLGPVRTKIEIRAVFGSMPDYLFGPKLFITTLHHRPPFKRIANAL